MDVKGMFQLKIAIMTFLTNDTQNNSRNFGTKKVATGCETGL